jgi:hypothetical protein
MVWTVLLVHETRMIVPKESKIRHAEDPKVSVVPGNLRRARPLRLGGMKRAHIGKSAHEQAMQSADAITQRHHERRHRRRPSVRRCSGPRRHRDPLRIATSIGTKVTQPEYSGDRSPHSARESAETPAWIPGNLPASGRPDNDLPGHSELIETLPPRHRDRGTRQHDGERTIPAPTRRVNCDLARSLAT